MMLQIEMDLIQLLFDNFLKLLHFYFDSASIRPGYNKPRHGPFLSLLLPQTMELPIIISHL